MTQEDKRYLQDKLYHKRDKELLLKDLCARLPYEVKVKFYDHWVDEYEIIPLTAKLLSDTVYIGDIKPYLFPLSSMTEEQYWEMQKLSGEDCLEHMEISKNFRNNTDFSNLPLYEYRVIDWLNRNHFDYRGLIQMGLAIDATGLNIY